jgi:hypothetical protein
VSTAAAASTQLSTGQRLLSAACAAAMVLLFLIANRAAYRGFCTDDDFDNLANAREIPFADYPRAFAIPALKGDGVFRAAPYFVCSIAIRAAGLHFSRYIAMIHGLHLINVFLVWWLARALGASIAGRWAAAALFEFNIAVFDIYWKPMYIFDLLCGTFVLLTLLSYLRGHLVLSIAMFWLSLKSKEVALLLPAVLAAYEYWIGSRRWKRLLPFFAIAAWMAATAVFNNIPADNEYTLRFTPTAIWKCVRYYMSGLTPAPYLGFAALSIPLVWQGKRVRLGFVAFLLLLLPMLVLPGRLFLAYLYVPLIGLAIAISAATRPVWIALFFAVWIPWNYSALPRQRRAELAAAEERRNWFQAVDPFVRDHPEIDNYVFDGQPETMGQHGMQGILRLLRPNVETHLAWSGDAKSQTLYSAPRCAVIYWDYGTHLTRVEEHHK